MNGAPNLELSGLVRRNPLAKSQPARRDTERDGHSFRCVHARDHLSRFGIAPRLDADASSGGNRAHRQAGALAGLLEASGEAFMQSAEDSVPVLWNRIYRLYQGARAALTEWLVPLVPVREPARRHAESGCDLLQRV